MSDKRNNFVSFLTLFTSSGTLVCCALPALFVTLGLGATFGSLVSTFPQLVWLSVYKIQLFTFSGFMLAGAGYLQWRARFAPCPIDPELARSCMKTRRISRIIYFVSVAIYLTGFFFAFVITKLIN